MAKTKRPRSKGIPKPDTGKTLAKLDALSGFAKKVAGSELGKPRGPRPVPPGKVPWAEQVEERLAAKAKLREEMIARGEDVSALDDRTGKCTAWTTGNYGPRRPCDRDALKGAKTCAVHTTRSMKEYIRLRLLEEVPDTIDDLVEIRKQREHMPSAVAAAKEILNRVAGKPDSIDKDKGSSTPKISIGLNIGAIPKKLKQSLQVTAQITDGSEKAVDGEIVETTDDDDNDDED